MPELPEVENFRQLLLPLIGDEVSMVQVGDHPRVKIDGLYETTTTDTSMKKIKKIICTDVLRRGKQICLVLSTSECVKYLFLHMGMTGRIRVYGKSENWGEKQDRDNKAHSAVPLDDEALPPKFTCLIFTSATSNYTAYFCDPRKFGSAYIANDLNDLESLAPDALTCTDQHIISNHILPSLTNQRLGIKAILLDQKRAVSGVGNWVADEVLYQCKMHPDQTKLDHLESKMIYEKLNEILSIAVKALKDDNSYPEDWLFHYRWTGKKSGKDAEGRSISFITSGGRTTAIINTIQKLYKRNNPSQLSPSKKVKSTKKSSHDLVTHEDVSKKDSQKNTKLKSKYRKKLDDSANDHETITKPVIKKKQSKRQIELKPDILRKGNTKTDVTKAKRQKVADNKDSKGEITVRRTSPRFKSDESQK
jgi:formamidopyrimidine-DNA glycosylase